MGPFDTPTRVYCKSNSHIRLRVLYLSKNSLFIFYFEIIHYSGWEVCLIPKTLIFVYSLFIILSVMHSGSLEIGRKLVFKDRKLRPDTKIPFTMTSLSLSCIIHARYSMRGSSTTSWYAIQVFVVFTQCQETQKSIDVAATLVSRNNRNYFVKSVAPT